MKRTFVVPEETLPDVVIGMAVKIVETIPEDWRSVWGILIAPSRIVGLVEVLTSTQLVFANHIQVICDDHSEEPDVFGIMMEERLPEQVLFGDAFGRCKILALRQVKKFAVRFLNKGYRGRLDFRFMDCNPVDESHCYYSCEVWLPPKGISHPPTVSIEWGKDAVEPRQTLLIEMCQKLGLTE